MILIDSETSRAVDKNRLRARYPQLASGERIVRDGSVIQLVLSRAGTLAGNEHLLSVNAYRKVKRSIGPAATESSVNANPLLYSSVRIVSDRDVVQLAGR